MDIITGKILNLKLPDGKIIGIAKRIGAELSEQGFDRETSLRGSSQFARTRVLSG